MKLLTIITLIGLLLSLAQAFTSFSFTRPKTFHKLSASKNEMPYDDDKMLFYALGTNLAMQVGGSVVPICKPDELEVALEGFTDYMKGTATQDARTVLEKYGRQLNEILQQRANMLIDGNKRAGEAMRKKYLDSNPEATETESGLIYHEINEGTGESPTMESMVEVNYHGTLADGTVVDSSIERGEPMNFPLKDVIKGWGEGLQLMKEGGKATLVIPSDLAYGDGGSVDVIPGGSTLKFEVELLHVSTPTENKVELPDGSTIRLPEGVKVRMVDAEDE